MSDKQFSFKILFEELDKLPEDSGIRLDADELQEYEEIRILREIALEMQTPPLIYFTST